MTNQVRAFALILLTTSFVIFPSFLCVAQEPEKKPPLRCTKEALAAFIPFPKLDYECRERQDDSLKSPERRAALRAYLRELESLFNNADWWLVPVEDLNVCSVIHEARAMSDEERHNFNEESIYLYGDKSTRLVVTVDLCIFYSYTTLNAFILQRGGDRVFATQVLDAYYTRLDAAVDMGIATQNSEKVILVETHTSDGTMPPSLYTTCSVYAIDPRSHRAIQKKLFKEGRKLTNKFTWDNYLFEDEKLAKQWRAPEIIRDGRLVPRFYVYTLFKHRFVRTAYAWNGNYYARQ